MYPKGPKQEPAAFASQPMIEAAQVEFRRGLGRGGGAWVLEMCA